MLLSFLVGKCKNSIPLWMLTNSLSLVSGEGSWVKLNLQQKYNYYYNTDSKEGSWVSPESCLPKESWLTGEEIEVGGWCFVENSTV